MRRIPIVVLAAALAAAFAACGSSKTTTSGGPSKTPQTSPSVSPTGSGTALPPSSTPTPKAPPTGQASEIPRTQPPSGSVPTLHVLLIIEPGGGMYVEGAKHYIRVSEGSTTAFESELEDKPCPDGKDRCPRLSRPLAQGRYVLTSYQRPCDGNCDNLDPPTDQCSAPFEMRKGQDTYSQIRLRPGDGCRIEFT